MGTIEIFDHTADVGLRIRANSLDDLFQTAAEAVFDYIVANRTAIRLLDAETVMLREESPVDLLAAWISELIFRSETQHRVYGQFAVRVENEGRSLQAMIQGEPIDRDRHILDHEVKAVTRHGLMLEQEGDEWVTEMILDI